jgi:hypothetical protein
MKDQVILHAELMKMHPLSLRKGNKTVTRVISEREGVVMKLNEHFEERLATCYVHCRVSFCPCFIRGTSMLQDYRCRDK